MSCLLYFAGSLFFSHQEKQHRQILDKGVVWQQIKVTVQLAELLLAKIH